MKLYRVTFDGQPDFIEAATFGAAIVAWRLKLIADNTPGDFDDSVEPESVELVHDAPVIRAALVREQEPKMEAFAGLPADKQGFAGLPYAAQPSTARHPDDIERDRRVYSSSAALVRETPQQSNYYGKPLTVSVQDGELRISIGVDVLAHAVSYSDWANPYDEDKHEYIRTFAITDAEAFARDARLAMLREQEDGSSPLSDFLDAATNGAVDDGSEACDYEVAIHHGQTAPVETWATAALTPPPPSQQQEPRK